MCIICVGAGTGEGAGGDLLQGTSWRDRLAGAWTESMLGSGKVIFSRFLMFRLFGRFVPSPGLNGFRAQDMC